MTESSPNGNIQGHQRLSIDRLNRWRDLDYGMFIHYGLATFTSQERGGGIQPIEMYQPTELDVDQWVRVAKDAGMNYIILTAKHCRDGGFSIWPTKQSDFSVANAPERTDVIGEFVKACDKYGVKPAIYIGGDRYNIPNGMVGGTREPWFEVSREYMDLTLGQLEELLTWYGQIEEVWFDGPHKYGLFGRWELTRHIASLQPDAIVAMNGTWEDHGRKPQMKPYAWPSDLLVIEAGVPPIWGTNCWKHLDWDPTGNLVNPPPSLLPTCGKLRYSPYWLLWMVVGPGNPGT